LQKLTKTRHTRIFRENRKSKKIRSTGRRKLVFSVEYSYQRLSCKWKSERKEKRENKRKEGKRRENKKREKREEKREGRKRSAKVERRTINK
jgi:hypothetical protein